MCYIRQDVVTGHITVGRRWMVVVTGGAGLKLEAKVR